VRSRALAAALLLAVTLAVYAQVRHHDFVRRDDYKYIVDNPDVRAPLGVDSLVRLFTAPHHGDSIPLTYLSLQIDHALFGMDPGAFHRTNVLLHALSTLVLFAALTRMTGALWRSGFAAAVFAIHPLHVESVAWAFERKDTLAGLFFMLGLAAYSRYAERPGPWRYAAVFACQALGLLAKPIAVTLPLVLLLLDFWPLGRLGAHGRALDAARTGRAVLEKLPLVALCALATAVLLAGHGAATSDMPFFDMPLRPRLENALVSSVVQLREAFWPAGLAVFHPYPLAGLPAWQPLLAGALLAAASAGALLCARRLPHLAVGWFWYAVTLAPVSGIVLNAGHARADRNTYLPLVGLAIAVAWGAVDLAGPRRRARLALAALGAASLAALAIAAARQVATWRDTLSLFEQAVAVTRENALAHYGLAAELRRRGRLDEAEHHYREALRIEPLRPGPPFELAELLRARGRLAEAVPHYEAALRLSPDSPAALAALGDCLVSLGRFEAARRELERAVALAPQVAAPHALLAVAYAGLGRPRDAVAENRAALALAPDLVVAANNLAWQLATSSDPAVRDGAEAVRVAESVLARSREPSAALLDTLAAAYAAAGRFEQAAEAAERALALAPDAATAGEIRARLEGYRAGRAYVAGGGASG
jgi:tetratricopeptide (TPR) repeat protein